MSQRESVFSFSEYEPPRKKRQTEWTSISPRPGHGARQTPVSASLPLSPNTQFEFVDARSAASRTVVQKHSMRHYLRQKRLREIETLRSSAPIGRLQWQLRQLSDHNAPKCGREKVTLEDILSDTDTLRSRSVSNSPSPIPTPSSHESECRKCLHLRGLASVPSSPNDPSMSLSLPCFLGAEESLGGRKGCTHTVEEMLEATSKTAPAVWRTEYETLPRTRLRRHQLGHWYVSTGLGPWEEDTYDSTPRNSLGAGNVDPFITYPITLDSLDLTLLDYYVSSRCTRASHATFFRRIVADALQDPAAFHVFLAYSAHHVSSLRSAHTLESRAMIHKGKGISLINKRLSTYSSLRDENLQAILFMLAIENAFGSKKASNTHIDGLRRMISSRGRLQSIENTWLLLQICWAEMTGTGRMSMDCVPSCDTGLISNSLSTYLSCPALSSGIDIYPDQTLVSLCDKFIFSLQDYQLLSFTRQCAGREFFCSPSFAASQCKSVSLAFLSGTSLQKLLVLPKSPKPEDNFISIRDQCHLASLVYIHASLWEFRHSVATTDEFVGTLESQLVNDDLYEKHGSIEALLWALLTDGRGNCLVSPARTQQVLQMMAVARRLKRDSWNVIQDILLQGLAVRHWSEVGVLDARWDAEKIRIEVLSHSVTVTQ